MSIPCQISTCPPGVTVEYTDIKGSLSRVRHHRPIPEHVTGYPLYSCCDFPSHETGFYLLEPVETFNLVRNPTFFNDLRTWDTLNSRMARTNEWAFDQGYSVRISGSGDTQTAERRAYIETEITDAVKGQPYTASSYIYLPQLWDTQDPRMGSISIVDQVGTDFQEVFSNRVNTAKRWERVSVSKGIRPNAEKVFMRIYLRSQAERDLVTPFNETGRFNLAQEYLYADMSQFEPGSEPTTPFHGDYSTCASNDRCCSGYKWVGNPHRSASFRPACARDGGKLKSLCEYGFEIQNHSGHGAPPVRDISIPYANKPGSEYQKTAVDDRILTFTSYTCGHTLEEVECNLFKLKQRIMPKVGQCEGKFLLVYLHKDCVGLCDPERMRAICVTYQGGFETTRDSLYRQNLTLQFKAHDPVAWFDWPGHSSQGIPTSQVVQSNRILKINADGSSRGFPIDGARDVRAVGCLPGIDRVVFGGNFQSATATQCDQNLALYDCNALCNLQGGVAGGAVNVIEPDGAGNLLIGGDFLAPGRHIAIIYGASNQTGFFRGYTGGPVLSIAAPFWGQVVVGTANGIHFLVNDQNDQTQGWRDYVTNGPVYDLAVAPNGDVYAVGDFTEIRGAGTPTVPSTNTNFVNRIARFNVNVNGECLNIAAPEWQSVGYGFDAAVREIEIDPKTGDIYVGGDFLNAVPTAQNVCNILEGTSTQSRGNDQAVIFSQVAGTTYTVQLQVSNAVAAQLVNQCFANPPAGTTTPYVRVTATSAGGTTYNLVLPGPPVIGAVANNLTPVTFTIDIAQVLPPQCASLNSVFASEFDNSRGGIGALAGIPLTNGNGNDNTINSMLFQCVGLQTVFTGQNIPVSRVAKLEGNNVQNLGNGLPASVRALMLNPETRELWAGMVGNTGTFTDGLAIWNGQDWGSFPGDLAGLGQAGILDIKYCKDDCSVIFVMDRDGASKLYGSKAIDYQGNFGQLDASIYVHGPGNLEHLGHHPCSKFARLCSALQCGEVANLNTGTAQLTSNVGRDLNPSILPGSRLDYWLGGCDDALSVYVDNGDATTKATVVYRPHYWGLDGMCCVKTPEPPKNLCCNSRNMVQSRAPGQNDCRDEGHRPGDLWYDAFGCGQLFVLADDKCCDPNQNGLMAGGTSVTTPTSETVTAPQNLCPPGVDCNPTNPTTCPIMTPSIRFPTGLNTGTFTLTGLQPLVIDFPTPMNTTTVTYNIVMLINLSVVAVNAFWSNNNQTLALQPTAPWPAGAKQLTVYRNASDTANTCRLLQDFVYSWI